MVNIKTNLLKNRQTLSEKDYQQERKLLRYSIFDFGNYCHCVDVDVELGTEPTTIGDRDQTALGDKRNAGFDTG